MYEDSRTRDRRLFVVDDCEDFSKNVDRLLYRQITVDTAAWASDAIERGATAKSALAFIVDANLPFEPGAPPMVEWGLNVVRVLRRVHPVKPFLLITGLEGDWLEREAKKCGATAFARKPNFHAVRWTVFYGAGVSHSLRPYEAEPLAVLALDCGLTLRETEVAALAVRDLPHKKIARELGMTDSVFDEHVQKLKRKTGEPTVADIGRRVRSAVRSARA